jgi:hypothetical protein
MKYVVFILAITLMSLCACTGGEDKVVVPKDVISPDSMVGILSDFNLVEAAIQTKQQERKDPLRYTGFYYSFILKKHHINRKQLDNSLQFYSFHPKLMREIYEKVMSELSTKQSRTMQ